MQASRDGRAETQRWLLDDVVGEEGDEEDGEPVSGKGVGEGRSAEDLDVEMVQEEGLPEVGAVGEDADVGDDAQVEEAADGGARVADAPEHKGGDGGVLEGEADGQAPVVLEAGVHDHAEGDDGGWQPRDAGDLEIELLKARGALEEGDDAAEHEGVGAPSGTCRRCASRGCGGGSWPRGWRERER